MTQEEDGIAAFREAQFDNDEQFTVHVTGREDLLEKITTAWRRRFPRPGRVTTREGEI